MGDGTKENPFTSEDVLKKIEENGGDARRLKLPDKWFEVGINLQNLPLEGINLQNGIFPAHIEGSRSIGARFDGSSMLGANLRNASLKDASFGMYGSKPTAMQGVDLRGAHLENANFQGADLTGAQFQGVPIIPSDPSQAAQFQWKLWEILPSRLEETDFRYAVLTLAQFKGCYFYGTKLKGAYIRGADIFDAHLEEADWGSYIIGEEKSGDFYSAENIYRRLKIWYTEHGIYDVAGKFFYREMEAKRKAQSWKKEPASKLWSWVMRLLCGYGERYGNVVVVALVIIFGLAVVYGFGGLNLAYAIYFSAVSFTALGYGSWAGTPIGWVQGLGAAESFIGVFMMALFLITFIRKMTR